MKMKTEKEVAQLFDVSKFENEVKLKNLLADMRLDVWMKAITLFPILTLVVALFVENKISDRSIEKVELVKAGLGEYKSNSLTGEVEFHMYKVVNGQLVKE